MTQTTKTLLALATAGAFARTDAFGAAADTTLKAGDWAVFLMPETKGGTTEDIERRLGIGR